MRVGKSSDGSLRSKRFRLVSEQRKIKEGDFRFGFDRARNETRATFLAVFDSRSSFVSPKPYRNACYAGYPMESIGSIGNISIPMESQEV